MLQYKLLFCCDFGNFASEYTPVVTQDLGCFPYDLHAVLLYLYWPITFYCRREHLWINNETCCNIMSFIHSNIHAEYNIRWNILWKYCVFIIPDLWREILPSWPYRTKTHAAKYHFGTIYNHGKNIKMRLVKSY